MKSKMTRAGTGFHFEKRLFGICPQLARRGIKAVNEYLVGAKVAGGGEAVVAVEIYQIRMGRFLPVLIRAGARLLLEVDGRSERSAFCDRQHDDITADIICREHKFVFPADNDVTARTASLGCLFKNFRPPVF